MADDILNMSLDDIIKKNAEKAKQAKPRKPKAAGKDQPKAGKPNRLGRVNQGAIGKKPQAVRGRQVRTALSVIKNDASKREALEGGGKWKHDMFTQSGGGRGAAGAPGRAAGSAKLVVSNLAFHVSEADLTVRSGKSYARESSLHFAHHQELFSTVGRVQRVTIKYDKSGRSVGEADVVFAAAADAERAKSQYQGAKLDGRQMQLEVAAAGGPNSNGTTTLSSGVRITTAKVPARTNLQLPRALLQATGSNGRPAGGRGRARLNSRVVQRGKMASDTMEE